MVRHEEIQAYWLILLNYQETTSNNINLLTLPTMSSCTQNFVRRFLLFQSVLCPDAGQSCDQQHQRAGEHSDPNYERKKPQTDQFFPALWSKQCFD